MIRKYEEIINNGQAHKAKDLITVLNKLINSLSYINEKNYVKT